MREVAEQYGQRVEMRFYQAGRDMDYVARYGLVMRGTLIIDGRVKIERLDRATIESAIADAVEAASR